MCNIGAETSQTQMCRSLPQQNCLEAKHLFLINLINFFVKGVI